MRTRHPARNSSKTQPPAEVLLRGLSVLAALNRRPVSSVEQIAQVTRLPKPTVVRMLSQLVSAAYVQRLPKRRGYRLDERVMTLSAGFRSPDAIVRHAQPILSRFTSTHKWPVSLATLEGDAMRVRSSTLHESPFATDADLRRLARRVPILTSAHGRAYLAFCPDDEREIIVALLCASARKDDLPARDPEHVAQLVRVTRRASYAVSAPLAGEPAIGFAVPVCSGPRVLGSLSLRYLGKVISEQDVLRRYLSSLRIAADAIGAAASPEEGHLAIR